MQQRYEDLLGFDISELEDLSQKDKKILENSTIKSLFNENKQLKNKLDITYSYLTEMIKGEKLFTDKDYLFRAKLVLQKIKNLETKQCKNCKHYYTDYDCLHDYCNIKDKEVSIKDSCENWER